LGSATEQPNAQTTNKNNKLRKCRGRELGNVKVFI